MYRNMMIINIPNSTLLPIIKPISFSKSIFVIELSFQWQKKYSKFNIFHTLGLKIMKSTSSY
jgi:hypothetical protein